jgi:phospholipid/cholesterol/gamma-HCH transport system substrate-binding protein
MSLWNLTSRSAPVRAFRGRRGAVVSLAVVWLASILVGSYLLAHQRITLPSWFPVIGHQFFIINADVTSVSGVLPGQGQAVTISGVTVGSIEGIKLQNGVAVATLRVKEQYAHHIYPDATVLLRPKTGLKDMIAELDPGSSSSGAPLKSGVTLGLSSTEPDVDFDEILASLDTDSRNYLDLLVGDAGRALGNGGGRNLANVFRRFDPLSRDVAKATSLVALRRQRLKRVMFNLSLIATELGDRDQQLATFVTGSEGVFRRFASQNANLAETVSLLPGALQSSNRALVKVNTLGQTLRTSLTALDPTARALAPALRDLQPFLRKTTPVIRNELRPFTIAAQPTARLLVPATRDFAQATPNLKELAQVLDSIVNELAYTPPGSNNTVGHEPFEFFIPWDAHNTNSVLSSEDAYGPISRGLVLLSCGSLNILRDLAAPTHNPTLATLIQLLNVPSYQQVCVK